MNDKNILELAAKAAGYNGLGFYDERLGYMWDGEGWTFDPKNDDGDCFRLAAKLRLTVKIEDHECEVFDQSGECLRSIGMHHAADEEVLEVVREAVTSAAAEIGRQMEARERKVERQDRC